MRFFVRVCVLGEQEEAKESLNGLELVRQTTAGETDGGRKRNGKWSTSKKRESRRRHCNFWIDYQSPAIRSSASSSRPRPRRAKASSLVFDSEVVHMYSYKKPVKNLCFYNSSNKYDGNTFVLMVYNADMKGMQEDEVQSGGKSRCQWLKRPIAASTT